MNKLFLFGLLSGICITLIFESFVHIYLFKKTYELVMKLEIKNDN